MRCACWLKKHASLPRGPALWPVAAGVEWESWERADRRDYLRRQHRFAKILRVDLAKRLLTFASAFEIRLRETNEEEQR